MAFVGEFIDILIETATDVSKELGAGHLTQALKAAGYGYGAAKALAEKNPEEAIVAFGVGVFATAVVAPELIELGGAAIARNAAMQLGGDAIASFAESSGLSSAAAKQLAAQSVTVASDVLANYGAGKTIDKIVQKVGDLAVQLADALGGSVTPISDLTPATIISSSALGNNVGIVVLPGDNASPSAGNFLTLPSTSSVGEVIFTAGSDQGFDLAPGTWASFTIPESSENARTVTVENSDSGSKQLEFGNDGNTTITAYSGANLGGRLPE